MMSTVLLETCRAL